MIGRLVGTIVTGIGQGDDGVTTVDVGGVGYEVMLSLGAIGRLRAADDGRVIVHVHTVVREDAFLLYGFPSLEERHVFRTLIGISSVGPKTALAILGALSVQELANAIARQELKAFTGVSGVGRKIAERILLELKDKLGDLTLAGSAAPPVVGAPVGSSAKAELLRGALSTMGFKPAEVDRAVDSVRDQLAGSELRELVRLALRSLGAPGS
jgi:Holliday junction DNA helicase RuvA